MIDTIVKVFRGIAKLRGATDNTLIGNVNDKLKVVAYPGPLDDAAPTRYQWKDFVDGTTTSMNVDGSLVAVNYSVVPDTSKNEFLESISITLHDPGNSKVGDFGSELALINGLQLQYQSNGTLSQLINIKTNSDLITYADELKDSDGLAGSSIITYTVYFSEAIVLKNSSSDFVRIIIQDDVTGISHLIAKAKLRRIVS